MAHQLGTSRLGVARMAYSDREIPWHRLGTPMKGLQTADAMLQAARADFDVELTRVAAIDKDGNFILNPDGTPVIIENRAGAGGQIAALALKTATADGSVLFLSHDHTISILPLINKKAGYEPATDFVPVAGFATFANGIALAGDLAETTLDQFVRSVRTQHQGKAAVGVPAPQSVPDRSCPGFLGGA